VFEGLKSRIFSIRQNTEESVLFVLKNQPLIDTAVHTGSFSVMYRKKEMLEKYLQASIF
jgi:hypothetical protein